MNLNTDNNNPITTPTLGRSVYNRLLTESQEGDAQPGVTQSKK